VRIFEEDDTRQLAYKIWTDYEIEKQTPVMLVEIEELEKLPLQS